MEGCGLGMLWVGVQIAFRGEVWREGCHGSVLIVCHERCPCEGWQMSKYTLRPPHGID